MYLGTDVKPFTSLSLQVFRSVQKALKCKGFVNNYQQQDQDKGGCSPKRPKREDECKRKLMERLKREKVSTNAQEK